jgi:hypothetical protein
MSTPVTRMVTAQRLIDGRVVYLRADRTFTQRDAEALATHDDAQIEAALAWASAQTEIVVEPYAIEVRVRADGTIEHATARERIRAMGEAAICAELGLAFAEPTKRAATG